MRYRREDGCRAWLACASADPRAVTGLIRETGSAETLYDLFQSRGDEPFRDRLTAAQLRRLRKAAGPEAMHRMMTVMQRHDIGVIACDDALYPAALLEIPDPPAFLFYRGNLRAAEGHCLTVVGARNASPVGLLETEKLTRKLSDAGVCIVSGLAPGIDTAAHEGCLSGESPAIGVCACGMDVDYPSTSSGLKRRILDRGGLLLSEFPIGMTASHWCFEMRNRILSGLSRAVVIMEGRIQSGSMLTVSIALDQGREVFAYPGIPNTEQAEGPHQLLREGARYFTTAADILEDLSWESHAALTAEQKETLPGMTPEQKRVLLELGKGDRSMDELVEATGMDAALISAAITMMQMMGLIRALPGKRYAKL